MKNSDQGPEIVRPPGASVPIPVRKDMGIEQIANECLEAVARDQYVGDIEDFKGKTRLEAAVLSLAQDAAEDPHARTEFLDRIMGKPKLRAEAIVTTFNLNDYLSQLAEEDDADLIEGEVVTENEDKPATSFT